ncbi:hypothetical protein FEM48_Zijuj11G0132300 [Ziziphus jujuba var. spinosa]|uniref:Uncharacterized protein n=1 Tax=Ziziphus jujuba var. spinosa TaxID=714518 RepID=A0A978UJ51_ZIZJJ|nr:hypothetical protein FEM48_Zijuj11G0132300 [Ziziphus jujuba var. spinosa]
MLFWMEKRIIDSSDCFCNLCGLFEIVKDMCEEFTQACNRGPPSKFLLPERRSYRCQVMRTKYIFCFSVLHILYYLFIITKRCLNLGEVLKHTFFSGMEKVGNLPLLGFVQRMKPKRLSSTLTNRTLTLIGLLVSLLLLPLKLGIQSDKRGKNLGKDSGNDDPQLQEFLEARDEGPPEDFDAEVLDQGKTSGLEDEKGKVLESGRLFVRNLPYTTT